MKGKIMTTETTTTVTLEDTVAEFVKSNGLASIQSKMVGDAKTIEMLQHRIKSLELRISEAYSNNETVENFLKQHIKDNDQATVGELKELADELDIELTKEVRVEFTVTYNYTIEVGLDEEVDDTDFRVNAEYVGDGEVTDESEDWSSVDIEDDYS